jgi:hypothetical protein
MLTRRMAAIVVLVAVLVGTVLALGASTPFRVAGWTWGEESGWTWRDGGTPDAAAPLRPAGWKWTG